MVACMIRWPIGSRKNLARLGEEIPCVVKYEVDSVDFETAARIGDEFNALPTRKHQHSINVRRPRMPKAQHGNRRMEYGTLNA